MVTDKDLNDWVSGQIEIYSHPKFETSPERLKWFETLFLPHIKPVVLCFWGTGVLTYNNPIREYLNENIEKYRVVTGPGLGFLTFITK